MVTAVRTARLDDAEAMGRIHVESWQAAYVGVVPQAHLDALDAEVVGIALVVPDRDGEDGVGEITIIYVHPSAWGIGAGYALMAECEAELRRRGFAEAVLWVLEDNPRARRFYERQGWRADGGRKVEEIGGVDLAEIRYRRMFEA